ncbi:hypothetical protein F5Y17DRAFT_472837 [Xylariaceae sp. FL0594]|nr:hypothetical protein F5Y17DRAFT_472837 [Xylariaceae sp. FL0594]
MCSLRGDLLVEEADRATGASLRTIPEIFNKKRDDSSSVTGDSLDCLTRLPSYSDFIPGVTTNPDAPINDLTRQLATQTLGTPMGNGYAISETQTSGDPIKSLSPQMIEAVPKWLDSAGNNGKAALEIQFGDDLIYLSPKKAVASAPSSPGSSESDGITPDDSISQVANRGGREVITGATDALAVCGGRRPEFSIVQQLHARGDVSRRQVHLNFDKSSDNRKTPASPFETDLFNSPLEVVNRDGKFPKSASEFDLFKNTAMEVKISDISGHGVFALRDLEPYTPVLAEHELLRGSLYKLYEQYDGLTEEQKTAYMKLHGHKETPDTDVRVAIWHTNQFVISGKGHLFLVGSRFNHSCEPNVQYKYDRKRKYIYFTTRTHVKAGEELLIKYTSDPEKMVTVWGFQCGCSKCRHVSEEQAQALKPIAAMNEEEYAHNGAWSSSSSEDTMGEW